LSQDASAAAQNTRPYFSVCVANYNGETVIRDCLSSVLSQEWELGVELLVHDDASTDNSLEIIRNGFPRARLVASRENAGFCESNNRLARIAQGEVLLFLNNDARLRPGALAALARCLKEAGGMAVAGLPQYHAGTGALLDRGSLLDPFLNSVPNLSPSRKEAGMVTGACLCLPRALWEAVGGFPPWFGSLAEDLFVSMAARGLGFPVRVAEGPGFDHWVGAQLGGGKVEGGRLRTTFGRRAKTERNKCRVMVLLWPAAFLATLFPLHLTLLALEGAALTLVRRDTLAWRRVYGPCFASLWRERAFLLRERARCSPLRRVPPWRWSRVFTPVPHKIPMLLRHGMPRLS
jgi:GT2 family glycosyltransferase